MRTLRHGGGAMAPSEESGAEEGGLAEAGLGGRAGSSSSSGLAGPSSSSSSVGPGAAALPQRPSPLEPRAGSPFGACTSVAYAPDQVTWRPAQASAQPAPCASSCSDAGHAVHWELQRAKGGDGGA